MGSRLLVLMQFRQIWNKLSLAETGSAVMLYFTDPWMFIKTQISLPGSEAPNKICIVIVLLRSSKC